MTDMTAREWTVGMLAALVAGMISGIWWPDDWRAGAIAGVLTIFIVPVWTRRMGWLR